MKSREIQAEILHMCGVTCLVNQNSSFEKFGIDSPSLVITSGLAGEIHAKATV